MMLKRSRGFLLGAAALALSAGGVAGQVSIAPQIGVYMPGGNFYEVRDQANDVRLRKEGTLGLGLVLEAGWVRASIAYATGATINDRGIDGRANIGEGSVLAAAADLVIRPLPRVLIQPYLLGGAGIKNASYNADSGFTGAFPKDETVAAAHVGIGADLMLGGFGIMGEITDFISRNNDGDWKVHDAFATVGLKFRL